MRASPGLDESCARPSIVGDILYNGVFLYWFRAKMQRFARPGGFALFMICESWHEPDDLAIWLHSNCKRIYFCAAVSVSAVK